MLGKEYSYEFSGKNLGTVPLLNLRNKIVLIVDKSNNSYMENKQLSEYINMTSGSVFMRIYEYYGVKNNPDINELQEYNKNIIENHITNMIKDKKILPYRDVFENKNTIFIKAPDIRIIFNELYSLIFDIYE
jgi:hypothetical protein